MLSPDQIAEFLTGKVKHARYDAVVKIREDLLVHTRGKIPEDILNLARPNEEEAHKIYRRAVWKPITKAAAGKVITQTAKIQRSQGFGLSFPKEAPAIIRKGETLREYLEQNFPVFDSVMNYMFQAVVREAYEDPHGVLVVHPMEYETELAQYLIKEGQYLKPYPYYFHAGEVLDYVEGQYAVILKDEKVSYRLTDGTIKDDGNVMLIVDEVNYYFFTQTGKDKDSNPIYDTRTFVHNLPYIPVWQLGSNDIEKQFNGYNLYNSFLSPCIPNWDQAVNSFSDHQVNQVMHIHPEKWYKTKTECKVCGNKGRITEQRNNKNVQVACSGCGGAGYIIKVSPFAPMIVAPTKSSVSGNLEFIDGDPAGYIAKPTNDMEFIKAEYKDQIAQGLSAIGLDYIDQTPLNQSGKAKEYDRQEINTFFYAVATYIANRHLYNIVYFTNELRYGFVDPKQREEYFKAITFSVPEQFDVVGSDYYYQQYVNAQSNKDDAEIVASKALEYARVEFGEDSPQFKKMQSKYELDPLPGLTPDQKLEYQLSGVCTAEDFIISQQLYAFLNRAIAEDEAFLDKPYADKMAKLNQYADEKKNQSVSRKLEQPPMFTQTKTVA